MKLQHSFPPPGKKSSLGPLGKSTIAPLVEKNSLDAHAPQYVKRSLLTNVAI